MLYCKGIVKGKIGFIKGARTKVNDYYYLMLCHESKGNILEKVQFNDDIRSKDVLTATEANSESNYSVHCNKLT